MWTLCEASEQFSLPGASQMLLYTDWSIGRHLCISQMNDARFMISHHASNIVTHSIRFDVFIKIEPGILVRCIHFHALFQHFQTMANVILPICSHVGWHHCIQVTVIAIGFRFFIKSLRPSMCFAISFSLMCQKMILFATDCDVDLKKKKKKQKQTFQLYESIRMESIVL